VKRILVVGGTGTVGRQVVLQLAGSGAEVRAMSRNSGAAGFPAGVEVKRGDLTDPTSLDPCLEGVDAVFLVWTAPEDTAPAAIERIAKHARRIVFLSAPLKTAHPLFQQKNALRGMMERIERKIEDSGCAWTFLRPGMFAANALGWWAPQIHAGDAVRWPYLQVPTAPIDEKDIARVAVHALCEDGHAGKEYVLTGPESLSQLEQVNTVGRAAGRSLRIEEMSPDEARREMVAIMPAGAVNMLLEAWSAAAGRPAHVTSTLAEITGQRPKTFKEWATEHAAEFRA